MRTTLLGGAPALISQVSSAPVRYGRHVKAGGCTTGFLPSRTYRSGSPGRAPRGFIVTRTRLPGLAVSAAYSFTAPRVTDWLGNDFTTGASPGGAGTCRGVQML